MPWSHPALLLGSVSLLLWWLGGIKGSHNELELALLVYPKYRAFLHVLWLNMSLREWWEGQARISLGRNSLSQRQEALQPCESHALANLEPCRESGFFSSALWYSDTIVWLLESQPVFLPGHLLYYLIYLITWHTCLAKACSGVPTQDRERQGLHTPVAPHPWMLQQLFSIAPMGTCHLVLFGVCATCNAFFLNVSWKLLILTFHS